MGRKKAKDKTAGLVKAWAKAVSGEWGFDEVAPGAVLDTGFRLEADLTPEELAEIAEQFKAEEASLPVARDCPVCGSKATTGLDNHGLYRTHCADERCRFGDAYARETGRESIDMWNVIGPPSVVE
jgi:hypothetical protein